MTKSVCINNAYLRINDIFDDGDKAYFGICGQTLIVVKTLRLTNTLERRFLKIIFEKSCEKFVFGVFVSDDIEGSHTKLLERRFLKIIFEKSCEKFVFGVFVSDDIEGSF